MARVRPTKFRPSASLMTGTMSPLPGKATAIHPPEHCLPGSGWDVIDSQVVPIEFLAEAGVGPVGDSDADQPGLDVHGLPGAELVGGLTVLTVSVSPMTTVPGAAPISLAIRSPTRDGWLIQSASFQAPINISPHSSLMVRSTRSTAFFGSGPRELPFR